jgi:DNA-binding XRE family transcriptional regulator
VTVKGKRMVMMNEADYEALLHKASADEPDLPAPDADGNYPALAALDVLQARDILRARRTLGLSQADLARRAGIRVETLNRIEHGKNTPSVPTIAKIDRALREAEEE